jgi:hypothetical protein
MGRHGDRDGDMDMETWTWSHGHGDMDTWRHGHMETWTHGDMETWKHGNMETWKHGNMETWKHGNMAKRTWRHQTENGSPGDFSQSGYSLLILRTEVYRLSFVDEETKRSYPFANGLSGLNGLAHLGS